MEIAFPRPWCFFWKIDLRLSVPNIVWGDPATDAFGGPFIAQYINWMGSVEQHPAPSIEIIESARVFPGVVTRREGPKHFGGQLVLDKNYNTVRASPGLLDGSGSMPDDVDTNVPATDLSGDHFFLGSAHRHFGHFILEGLSRLWAWDRFSKAYPDGKCIIYEATAPAFIVDMLERIGVERSRMLFMQEPLVVERLHAPDPVMRTHHWIDPRMGATWQTIASTANPPRSDKKIYLSRKSVKNRALENEEAIEDIFKEAGFEIVVPESLSIGDQIYLARSAKILAGCVGSQMYLAAFQYPGSDVAVIAPSNFYLRDDCLIAEALGHRVHVAFGSAVDFSTKERLWRIDASAAEAMLGAIA